MDLPIYCVVDRRLAKVEEAEEGAVTVLVFDERSQRFNRRMDFLTRIVLGDEDVRELTEAEFVAALRRAAGEAAREQAAS
jgi:hypothetical protein